MSLLTAGSLVAFWPVFSSYYYLDDFAFVTLVRYVQSPLAFFADAHFPGGMFYRPAGLLLWWLLEQLGLPVTFQFLVNWALLVCAAWLFFRLLLVGGVSCKLAAWFSLLFAVHPIATMTAGWLSNRFDLLATVGILIALHGAFRLISNRKDTLGLLAVSVGTFIAVLSKELGFILPLVIAGVVFVAGRRHWLSPALSLSGIIATTVFFVRKFVSTGSDSFLLLDGIWLVISKGGFVWLVNAGHFIFSGMPDWAVVLFMGLGVFIACSLLVALLWSVGIRRNAPLAMTNGWVCALAGFWLLILSVVVQTPVLAMTPVITPSLGSFADVAYFSARFYYLSLVGLLMFLAGLITLVGQVAWKPSLWLSRCMLALFTGIVTCSCVASWQINNQWASVAGGLNKSVAMAASQAAVDVFSENEESFSQSNACRLYFIGIDESAPFFWPYSDVIVKATLSPVDSMRLGHCLISTERTPWYHIVNASSGVESAVQVDLGPHQWICAFGRSLNRQSIDSADVYFLAYAESGDVLSVGPEDHVLRYDSVSGSFFDVTQDVLAGKQRVSLYWSRPDANRCH